MKNISIKKELERYVLIVTNITMVVKTIVIIFQKKFTI